MSSFADYTHPTELVNGNCDRVIKALTDEGLALNDAKEAFVRRLVSSAQPKTPAPAATSAAGDIHSTMCIA